MKTVANVMLVSSKMDDFDDKKTKEKIYYQRVVLLQPGDADTVSMTAPADLDLSGIKPMTPFNAVLDVYKNFQGYFKVKLVGIQG